jgi:hypothetical protein
MTNKWDFKEVARRQRRATEDDVMVREDGGGDGNLQKFCFVVGVLLNTQALNIKTAHV